LHDDVLPGTHLSIAPIVAGICVFAGAPTERRRPHGRDNPVSLEAGPR
jgi:hypothetical protein